MRNNRTITAPCGCTFSDIVFRKKGKSWSVEYCDYHSERVATAREWLEEFDAIEEVCLNEARREK